MKFKRFLLVVMCCLVSTGLSAAFSLSSSTDEETLIADVDGREFRYPNIIGDRYGLSTGVTLINNAPALFAFGRDSYYYTLKADTLGAFIDCAYADGRNSRNGAGVLAGMCGLNAKIVEDSQSIAQGFANTWMYSVYGFDTWPMISNKTSGDFLLGKIGEVEVYDRYASMDDLLNAKPEKYVKTSLGCYYFKQKLAFLVFNKPRPDTPVYLDVIRSHDPFLLDRLTEVKLKKMAVRKCR
ncbi:hypothetical protein [Pseudomonas sp. W2-17]|uniref:hypothetical protein n=1 Tax=Pseudomonas sp. W2-17 TaxID=3058039 RepID=UPI0034E0E060